MFKKSLLIATLLAAASLAHAQAPTVKQDLIARILKIQQPGIESMAQQLAEQPAAELVGEASQAIQQRVPADKRDALARDIQSDVKKYADEAVPLVRDRAVQLAPATVGALLDQRFTEDELRQLIAMIESPTYIKFQQVGPDLQRALIDKVIEDTRGAIETKVRALDEAIAKRFRPYQGGAPANKGATAPRPAKPASK